MDNSITSITTQIQNNNKNNTLEALLGLVIIGKQQHPDKVDISWLTKTFENLDTGSEINHMDIMESLLDLCDVTPTNDDDDTSSNTLTMSHSFSCDVKVQIPAELYRQYKSGEIDLYTFDNEVRGLTGDENTTYEINYPEYVPDMIENFLEEMKEEEG